MHVSACVLAPWLRFALLVQTRAGIGCAASAWALCAWGRRTVLLSVCRVCLRPAFSRWSVWWHNPALVQRVCSARHLKWCACWPTVQCRSPECYRKHLTCWQQLRIVVQSYSRSLGTALWQSISRHIRSSRNLHAAGRLWASTC
jgi:hypothetical protein